MCIRDRSFSRINKSRAESTNIWAVRVDSREYFNLDLDQLIPIWKKCNINTVIISAGRPYWINFRWPGHDKEYSNIVQLSNGDPLEKTIDKLKQEGFKAVSYTHLLMYGMWWMSDTMST